MSATTPTTTVRTPRTLSAHNKLDESASPPRLRLGLKLRLRLRLAFSACQPASLPQASQSRQGALPAALPARLSVRLSVRSSARPPASLQCCLLQAHANLLLLFELAGAQFRSQPADSSVSPAVSLASHLPGAGRRPLAAPELLAQPTGERQRADGGASSGWLACWLAAANVRQPANQLPPLVSLRRRRRQRRRLLGSPGELQMRGADRQPGNFKGSSEGGSESRERGRRPRSKDYSRRRVSSKSRAERA